MSYLKRISRQFSLLHEDYKMFLTAEWTQLSELYSEHNTKTSKTSKAKSWNKHCSTKNLILRNISESNQFNRNNESTFFSMIPKGFQVFSGLHQFWLIVTISLASLLTKENYQTFPKSNKPKSSTEVQNYLKNWSTNFNSFLFQKIFFFSRMEKEEKDIKRIFFFSKSF